MPDDVIPSGSGPFDGPSAFAECLRETLAAAAAQDWSEIWLSDADFADWPLGDRAAIDALQAWAGRSRRLRLLMRHDAVLRRQHPRFVAWRQRWDHIVDARLCADGDAQQLPSAFWTPRWIVERHDPERSRGSSSALAVAVQDLRHRIDDAFARGRPGFGASVLGL